MKAGPVRDIVEPDRRGSRPDLRRPEIAGGADTYGRHDDERQESGRVEPDNDT